MNLLQEGEQLPSVRSLASSLQINPMTISKAFAQLEIEEVLIRKRGVGMLVAQQPTQKNPSKEMNQSLKNFITTAHSEKFSDEEISILVQQYLSINKDL
jgi:GntR family transcriptional regulator